MAAAVKGAVAMGFFPARARGLAQVRALALARVQAQGRALGRAQGRALALLHPRAGIVLRRCLSARRSFERRPEKRTGALRELQPGRPSWKPCRPGSGSFQANEKLLMDNPVTCGAKE